MTDRYAVFGHPIAHSKPPQIHAAFARQTGQDMTYEAILAPKDGLADSVAQFIAAGGRGANVTGAVKEAGVGRAGGAGGCLTSNPPRSPSPTAPSAARRNSPSCLAEGSPRAASMPW